MKIDPRTPFYDDDRPRHIIRAAAGVAILGFILTLFVVVNGWVTKDAFWIYVAIGCWAVIPPSWFWWEYFYVYKKWGKEGTLDLFKYGQQVAGSVWAGVLAVLIALAASNIIKLEDTKIPDKANSADARSSRG